MHVVTENYFTLRLRKHGSMPPRKETKGPVLDSEGRALRLGLERERAKRVEGRIAQGEARRPAAAYFTQTRYLQSLSLLQLARSVLMHQLDFAVTL